MWITQYKKLFHSIKELFTLKQSRILSDFTLKRSRFSAETLPHSIYTYIYIYKKTNSCKVKTVDNRNKRIYLLFGYFVVLTLSGCCSPSLAEREQANALHLSLPPPKSFEQKPAGRFYPAKYYSCGELNNPCRNQNRNLVEKNSINGRSI